MFCAVNVYTSAISKLSLAICVKAITVLLLGCVCHAEIKGLPCTKLDPCHWKCSDGSTFDLNPMCQNKPVPLLKEIPGLDASTTTYSYDPCRSYNDTKKSTNCSDVSMCQNSQFAVGLFGSVELVNFTVNPDSFTLKYHAPADSPCHNNARVGLVTFYCNESVELSNSSVLESNSESDRCTYSLNITSSYACHVPPTTQPPTPGPAPPKKLSIGSILLIVFSVCLFIYIVGGILFLHFVRGHRGVEQFPNYSFWILIPGLIKDGFVFTCTKIGICKGDQVYERI